MSLNHDFFRISIDLSLMILLIRYGFISKGIYLITAYYGLFVVFNIYHFSFRKIYQHHPIIIDDLVLLKNAASVLWNENKVRVLILSPVLLGVVIFLVISFHNFLVYSAELPSNEFFRFLSFFLVLVFVVSLIRHGHKSQSDTSHRFIILLFRVVVNISESIKLLKKKKSFNKTVLDKSRKLHFELTKPPNIYFLFIESYGSILLRDKFLRSKYLKLINEFEQELVQEKWSIRSNLSTGVSLVGPSWLAYSTVLFGSRVDSQFYYNYILNEDRFYPYDVLPKVLQQSGYINYNLNGTKLMSGITVPFRQMERFFGVDRWILRKDIEYNGIHYGFTETPPDHYVLNYAYENYLSKEQQPYTLFYLTKNSHSPFISSETLPSDWKDWNDGDYRLIGNKFLQKPVINDYWISIKHQIALIKDFILKNGNKNDVFLLMGDHQPHEISKEAHGTETIVHIVSQNKNFVKGFESYGFMESVASAENHVKHEAIYSMLLREIIGTYGSNDKIPSYEPNGIKL